MKKFIVLFVLFILPIVAYLFFASGVNSFAKLSTITNNIPEISNFTSVDGSPVLLSNKITILGFTGSNIMKDEGGFFNLNQKIYEKNRKFKDFQFVMIAPNGTQEDVKKMLIKLKTLTTDTSGWHFVFGSPEEINSFYNKMNLVGKLNTNLRTPNVFIIDKNRNLRGRKGRSIKGDSEYKEGYNTEDIAVLYNEMTDDVKIILAEYRLALKRNHNATKEL